MKQDEQEIDEIVERLAAAWNSSDSNGIASIFAQDARFIHIFGGELNGREAIEASHRMILDTIYKDSRIKWSLRDIRFLRPDVAVAFTEARVQFPEGDPRPEVVARPTMTLVKENNRWQAAVFQNTRITEMPRMVKAAGS